MTATQVMDAMEATAAILKAQFNYLTAMEIAALSKTAILILACFLVGFMVGFLVHCAKTRHLG